MSTERGQRDRGTRTARPNGRNPGGGVGAYDGKHPRPPETARPSRGVLGTKALDRRARGGGAPTPAWRRGDDEWVLEEKTRRGARVFAGPSSRAPRRAVVARPPWLAAAPSGAFARERPGDGAPPAFGPGAPAANAYGAAIPNGALRKRRSGLPTTRARDRGLRVVLAGRVTLQKSAGGAGSEKRPRESSLIRRAHGGGQEPSSSRTAASKGAPAGSVGEKRRDGETGEVALVAVSREDPRRVLGRGKTPRIAKSCVARHGDRRGRAI